MNEVITRETTLKVKPFLRYIGGKRWFIKDHNHLLPNEINNYYEPFLGSGSIFFFLKQNHAISGTSYLSDINVDLITAFKQIKFNVKELIVELSKLKNTKEDFYEIRSTKSITELQTASKYIYLNRTCFGGIYRVNKKGEFNVPYGNRIYKKLIDDENLLKCSKILKNKTDLSSNCFMNLNISDINTNDFFCFDPPYLGVDTKFKRYNSKVFTSIEKQKLIDIIKKISLSGAKFILFVGNDNVFANQLKHLGDQVVLNRNNDLSFVNTDSIKKEIIIKNF